MDYYWIIKDKIYKYIQKTPDTTLNAVSGAISGVFSSIIVCPLDVVKTRLQLKLTNHNINKKVIAYRGFYDTFLRIWYEEGIRGFYRGLGPLVIGYFPSWAIYFTIYERCKNIYSQSYDSQSKKHIPWIINMKSAITAGAASAILSNPIWIVKTRLMSQNSNSHVYYQNMFDAFRKMYKVEGISSFYKGLTPSLFGVTHVAIQFPLYEFLKDIFSINITNFENPLWFRVVLASIISKMVAGSITYPHEVIRTRIQTQKYYKDSSKIHYRGLFHTFYRIYHEEGWKNFYCGMRTNLIRTVPASVVTLLTFEVVNKRLFQIKYHR